MTDNLKAKRRLTLIVLIFLLMPLVINSSSQEKDIANINITTEKNLKITGSPTEIPILLSPANESIDTSNIVRFDWTDVGNPSDEIFYEFIMDNDTDFSSPEVARLALNDWSNVSMQDDDYTTFISHFNNSELRTEENELPVANIGTELVPGKFGDGVYINSSKTSKLTYKVSGNLNKDNGSIEFWIRMDKDIEDIQPGDYEFMFDYIINGPPTVQRIVITISPDLDIVYAETWLNETDRYNMLPQNKTLWKAGEWHHVCLAWGEEMGRLYLDGKLSAETSYFPIGDGFLWDEFSIGSQYGYANWINATFDEIRISNIQRIPVWKIENNYINTNYFGPPTQRRDIWFLNESEYTHMFDNDGIFYWKVRAHNESGPGDWSSIGNITITRILDEKQSVSIRIRDINGDIVPNVNVSYNQTVISKLMGVDANYYEEMVEGGYRWYHDENEIELFEFFAQRRSNSFRTRLWTNKNGLNSLGNATKMARYAQGNGTIPYLTIFLSDTWSDVNKMPLPEIFKGLTFEERVESVKEYSYNVTKHFIDEGIDMEFYEIGNEIDYGICGVYADGSKDPRHDLNWLRDNTWYNMSLIIKAAIQGVLLADPDGQFMLHIAITDPTFALAFFTAMRDFGVPYDIIGLSYHPNHGGDKVENGFIETVKVLSTSGLPGCSNIIVPETSYGSNNTGTFVFPSWTHNITEFPQTQEGQKAWVKHQLEWIYQHPNVAGMNYWSPDYYTWMTVWNGTNWIDVTIWETFAWFNRTGDSKIVVDAYPEFFNDRKLIISSEQMTSSGGMISFDAYRGLLNITVNCSSHVEYFTKIVSPFRSNIIEIYLSIDLITHPSTSGGGSGGGGGGDSSQTEIPGYDPLLFIGFIGISSIIVIKKIIKKFK